MVCLRSGASLLWAMVGHVRASLLPIEEPKPEAWTTGSVGIDRLERADLKSAAGLDLDLLLKVLIVDGHPKGGRTEWTLLFARYIGKKVLQ